MATLVFPSSVPAARDYAQDAQDRGEAVVGASSLASDPYAAAFPHWEHLPSIYAEDFSRHLSNLVERFGITRILCPVASVHGFLQRLSAEGNLPVKLVGLMPIRREARRVAAIMAEADAAKTLIAAIAEDGSPLSRHEVAAVLNQSQAIYGESEPVKVAAMMAVFADMPCGDVVEIGALCGRTAYVLAHMARRHAIGNVLIVDPWDSEHAIQHDSPVSLLDLIDAWPPGSAFESFILSLLPLVGGIGFGYLPLPSADAYGRWAAERRVASAEFGAVDYDGDIAVLHIDGNHDLAAVGQDCALWLPHVLPGGWLILDDYVWLHGDGPRLVGDALLAQRSDVARTFVCGKALFVQFAGPQ